MHPPMLFLRYPEVVRRAHVGGRTMSHRLTPFGRKVAVMATRRITTSRSTRTVRMPVRIKTGSTIRSTSVPVTVKTVTKTITIK